MQREANLTWKVLVVDDESDVLTTTSHTLMDTRVLDRSLHILTATSAKEAQQQLDQHPDVAVILLDVVMEKMASGLALVNWIRQELNNRAIRIILRTGKAGGTPEHDAVSTYAIDDYIDKGSVTRNRVITAVVTAIRAFDQFSRVERMNMAMSALLEFSNAAAGLTDLPSLVDLVARRLGKVSPGLAAAGIAFPNGRQTHLSAQLSFVRADLKDEGITFDMPQLRMAQIHLAKVSQLKPSEYFLIVGADELRLVLWARGVEDFDSMDENILLNLVSTINVNLQRLALMHQRSVEFMTALRVVVHEFSTPLGALDITNEYLMEALKAPHLDRPRIDRQLDSNATVLGRMRLHLDSTLRNVTVVLGQSKVQQPVNLDVGKIVRNSVEGARALWSPIGEINIRIEDHCNAVLDKASLEQIVVNLLSNCVKAVLARPDRALGPQIKIVVARRARGVMMEISDQGIGIQPEHLARIYEPFFSVGSASHGLGLSMVQKSVQQMGGTLQCTSQPGRGTQFTVQFDAIAAQPAIL
jgi:signal transduction histidine kinase/CheY-like chemotaxis protein